MVDEFDGDDYELRSVVDAAQTPPFLTETRVVVGRGIGRFNADELAPLVDYLSDPLAIDRAGARRRWRADRQVAHRRRQAGRRITSPTPTPPTPGQGPPGVDRREGRGGRACGSTRRRRRGSASWLGEDVGRLDGILATLVSTYGTNRRLTAADVEPFLGEAGGVPPWDFTDAIDAGETTKALDAAGAG